MSRAIVAGSFDDPRSRDVRFLQEAARLGDLHVLLWSDDAVEALEGRPPKFRQRERQYFVEALRYVKSVALFDRSAERDRLPQEVAKPSTTWVVDESHDTVAKRTFSKSHELEYRVVNADQLQGFPQTTSSTPIPAASPETKVLVTGCYDWLHTGHVRFFEEVSELGDLYVVVGHDDNIRLLKGDGHPMFPEDERRYMTGSVRYVKRALISTGHGWLDAEPEIERIKPNIYAVNEDGDRPEKRAYCEAHGIDYRVLKRLPKEGLPTRESTTLRGF